MGERLVGRIDYLGISGHVCEGIEFSDEMLFAEEIRKASWYGVPIIVNIYVYDDGCIQYSYVYALDPPPKALVLERRRN